MVRVLSRPITAFVNSTSHCNLECLYCSSPSINDKDMTDEQLHVLMRNLAQWGVLRIVITGGEPLLRPTVLEIISQYSSRFAFTLITNGTLLSDQVALTLKTNSVKVCMSLDHFDHQRNDRVRGKTTDAMRGLETMLAYRIPVNLLVTVTTANYDALVDFSEWAFRKKIDSISFNPLSVVGQAEMNRYLTLSKEQNIGLVETFSKLRKRYGNRINADYWLAAERLFHKYINGNHDSPNAMQCGAAASSIAITSDGQILPCNKIKFPIGDAFSLITLDEWWHSAQAEDLRGIRECCAVDFEGCKTCILKHCCSGGCRGDAFNEAKDFFGAIASCWYEGYVFTKMKLSGKDVLNG